jgi:hypothetical protein
MANIYDFPPRQPAQDEEARPKKPMHKQVDDCLLGFISDWRMARAAQAHECARDQKATNFGEREDDKELDRRPLETMHQMENFLATWKPYSVRTARELLECVLDMLLHQQKDPESVLATGPVLEIVRNVWKAMSETDGDTRINTYCKDVPTDRATVECVPAGEAIH